MSKLNDILLRIHKAADEARKRVEKMPEWQRILAEKECGIDYESTNQERIPD